VIPPEAEDDLDVLGWAGISGDKPPCLESR
jgi:hypothetical protein